MNEGILRKIDQGKLRGLGRFGGSACDIYCALEAVAWLVCIGLIVTEGCRHFLSWLS